MGKTRDHFKKIRDTKGTFYAKMSTIKDKNSMDLTEAGFPRWFSGKESTCQCQRRSFDFWVRNISWIKEWLPTPVFFPGKSYRQESLVSFSPWDCKRVGHYLATKQQQQIVCMCAYYWRRKWQPTPVFLPGESRGRRSQVG